MAVAWRKSEVSCDVRVWTRVLYGCARASATECESAGASFSDCAAEAVDGAVYCAARTWALASWDCVRWARSSSSEAAPERPF